MSDERMSFEEGLDTAITKLGGPATEPELPRLPAAQRRRRGARPEDASTLAAVTLIDDDGLLRWVYEPPPRRSGRRRALRRAIPSIDGVPIRTIPIQDLPANQVLESIAALDKRMTPKRGLHLWRNGVLEPAPRPKIKAKRVLLFIHGTFSKSDMFFDELTSTPQGKQYLADAVTAYGGAVYAFDHPTLAVSPWINALELEAALADVSGTIDVVCHSRGGLVAAWWLRLSKRDVAHVILVGAPLAGTTLASPAALRQALDHLTTLPSRHEVEPAHFLSALDNDDVDDCMLPRWSPPGLTDLNVRGSFAAALVPSTSLHALPPSWSLCHVRLLSLLSTRVGVLSASWPALSMSINRSPFGSLSPSKAST